MNVSSSMVTFEFFLVAIDNAPFFRLIRIDFVLDGEEPRHRIEHVQLYPNLIDHGSAIYISGSLQKVSGERFEII